MENTNMICANHFIPEALILQALPGLCVLDGPQNGCLLLNFVASPFLMTRIACHLIKPGCAGSLRTFIPGLPFRTSCGPSIMTAEKRTSHIHKKGISAPISMGSRIVLFSILGIPNPFYAGKTIQIVE